jgi:nucleoside-diphosphate-sugar epimerase
VERSARAYGNAKIDAENICREFHNRGLSTTILRPSIVYGPFSKWWVVGTVRRLQSGNWGEFEGFGEGFCNAVYVDDLVDAVLQVMVHPAAIGEAFNVNGAELVTWNEYFRRVNAAIGRPPLASVSAGRSAFRAAAVSRVENIVRAVVQRFQEPLMDIYMRGGLATRVMKAVKTLFDTTPSPGELKNQYQRRARYADDKLRDLVGYAPRYDLDRGLALTVKWLAQFGYIESTSPERESPRLRPSSERTTVVTEPVAAAN